MEKVSITTSLLNTIVQYLANRPYIEVAGMIERFRLNSSQRSQKMAEKWIEGN
jgi:hypothetical protein